MSKQNDETLRVYDKTAQRYLDNTIAHDKMRPEHARRKREDLADRIRSSFGHLPGGATVLEIGAADGDNSLIFKSLGYDIIASDVAPAFIEACKRQGLNTIKFNVLKDDFPPDLMGIFAWRVFVHFTRDDIMLALNRCYDALELGGRFMFNVIDRATHDCDSEMKDFSGEYEMGAKRFYAYYREEDVLQMIAQTRFSVVNKWHEHGGHNDWFCFVLEK